MPGGKKAYFGRAAALLGTVRGRRLHEPAAASAGCRTAAGAGAAAAPATAGGRLLRRIPAELHIAVLLQRGRPLHTARLLASDSLPAVDTQDRGAMSQTCTWALGAAELVNDETMNQGAALLRALPARKGTGAAAAHIKLDLAELIPLPHVLLPRIGDDDVGRVDAELTQHALPLRQLRLVDRLLESVHCALVVLRLEHRRVGKVVRAQAEQRDDQFLRAAAEQVLHGAVPDGQHRGAHAELQRVQEEEVGGERGAEEREAQQGAPEVYEAVRQPLA